MYRIHQIKLGIEESRNNIPDKIAKKIGNKNLKVTDYCIVKESLDARNKSNIKYVYTIDFKAVNKTNNDLIQLKENPKLNLEIAPNMSYREVSSGDVQLANRPVIVGFGPCGMFTAWLLAKRGYKPLVIERGNDIDQRVKDVEEFWSKGVLNVESNVQFGEGGAGTFSDGKLTTGIKDPRIRKVLELFVKHGADEDIMYKQKPHIGTDVLRTVVKGLRNEIIQLGGEVRFGTKFISMNTIDGKVTSIKTKQNDKIEVINTECLIMALGHSARDTFRGLYEMGVTMSQKPFSIGVRIEHPQQLIDESQYGKTKGLPPADYKLSYHCKNGRGVYTFCMCPGGEVVIASSQEKRVVTNGMSNRARNSGTANSGMLVDVRCADFKSEHPLAGMEFQEKYESLAYINGGGSYNAPKSTWYQFKNKTKEGINVINSLPEFATEGILEAMPVFGRKLKGFDMDDAVLTAVETRSSSPVRFERNEDLESNIKGFYPAGEGTGYAGGIMSAACDGIKVAEKIIMKFSPIN